jgi:TRAP-type C4-dicarboxylate transport system permease small subunit
MEKLLAADDTINLQPDSGNFVGLTGLTLPDIISGLIKFTVVIAAIVFFFILVIGGIRWIASGGDKAQTEAARNQITAALVGLVIVFAAWAIVALINVFFKIDIFSLAIPTV